MKKNLKNRKKTYGYVFLLIDWWWFKFHAILLSFDRPMMVVLKIKIVQEYKEPKVEMYKSIWSLVFKCNGSRIQFNSIQFSQEYSNQRNMRKKKKRSNKNKRCNGVRLKNAYVSGTLNLQKLRLSRNTKKQFYTCRTWSLI
jgi:hypothetical protein